MRKLIISEKVRFYDTVRRDNVSIKTVHANDMDGDSFHIDFTDSYMELVAESETGCIVLSPEQAVELANKILAEVKL